MIFYQLREGKAKSKLSSKQVLTKRKAAVCRNRILIKVPFGLSPVSSSHHALLSYFVRILFWMLQLGIEVRVHGLLSFNPHLLLLSVMASDQELVQ